MDHSRVNEFGYSGDMIDEAAKGKGGELAAADGENLALTDGSKTEEAAAPAKSQKKTAKDKKED